MPLRPSQRATEPLRTCAKYPPLGILRGVIGFKAMAVHIAVICVPHAWPDGCWRRVCGYRHFVGEPTTLPWGNRSLLLRDPDGNLVNFFTPLTPAAIGKFAR
jgi:hypothetical protein